jgi:Flp pilus assembly pilin Flp
MFAFLIHSLRNEAGVTVIEYAVLTAILTVAMIVVLGSVGSGLSTTFTSVANSL